MIDSSDSSATLFPHRSCSLHFAVSGSESLPLVTFILKRYWHNAQTGALNLFPSNLMPLLNRGRGDIPLPFQGFKLREFLGQEPEISEWKSETGSVLFRHMGLKFDEFENLCKFENLQSLELS